MSSNDTSNGVYGSVDLNEFYSVPHATYQVLEKELLKNPLVASTLPEKIGEYASKVRFIGTDKPSMPIN